MNKSIYVIDLLAQPIDYEYLDNALKRAANDMAKAIQSSPLALKSIGEECVGKINTWYAQTSHRMGNDDPEVHVGYNIGLAGEGVVQLKVKAEGADTFFLEFGIGDDVSAEGGDFAAQSGVDVSSGSWSREHNGPYSRHGYWHYSKTITIRPYGKRKRSVRKRVTKRYEGVPGAHAMFRGQQLAADLAEKQLNNLLRGI